MLNALFYPVGTKEKPIAFDSLFIPYIYKEIYFDCLYVDIFNGQKNMTVVDIGANCGIVTQYMREFSKKIYAIEPSSEHFEALKKNKEFNKWDNVEIFNFAIADKDGEMTLNTLNSNRTCHSLVTDYKQGGEKVKTKALDTFFRENNITKCDFMKLDVEGAEDMILRSEGFKRVKDKVIAIEVEFHLLSWQELVQYMMSLGYEARRYDSSAIVVLFTLKP